MPQTITRYLVGFAGLVVRPEVAPAVKAWEGSGLNNRKINGYRYSWIDRKVTSRSVYEYA